MNFKCVFHEILGFIKSFEFEIAFLEKSNI